MKAIINTARGAAADTLKLATLDLPEPAAGEVRVKIHASGVNPSDVKLRSGAQGPMVAEQVVVHNDGAGVIDAVGAGVDTARIGQRVWLFNVNRNADGRGQGSRGTAAEAVCVPEWQAADLPDGVSFASGACFGVPAMTAHRAVTCGLPVVGATVLVTGGAGAVGHAAIQIAKGLGAGRVIATVSSANKAAIAVAAGSDDVINYREEDLGENLETLVGTGGIDHVVDVDLAAHVALYPSLVMPGATIAAYASGSDLTPAIPFYPLAFRNIAVQPVFVYSLSSDQRNAAIADINRLAESGALTPLIAKTFPLSEIVAAHEVIEAGMLVGNAVLEIAQ